LPYLASTGSASPDSLGVGLASPDLSGEGSASPDLLARGLCLARPLGKGSASPEPSDTISALPDPCRYARPRARARIPTPSLRCTPTTSGMATHDPDVRREVQPCLNMTSSHDSTSHSHASNSAEGTGAVVPNSHTVSLLTTPCAMTGQQRPRVTTAMDRTATWGRPHHRLQGRQGPLAGEGGRRNSRTPSPLFCFFSLSSFPSFLSFLMYYQPFPWPIKRKDWYPSGGDSFRSL
jgi:hypothetical protein